MQKSVTSLQNPIGILECQFAVDVTSFCTGGFGTQQQPQCLVFGSRKDGCRTLGRTGRSNRAIERTTRQKCVDDGIIVGTAQTGRRTYNAESQMSLHTPTRDGFESVGREIACLIWSK